MRPMWTLPPPALPCRLSNRISWSNPLLFPDKNRAAHARDLQQRSAAVHRAIGHDARALAPRLNSGIIGYDTPKRVRHPVLGLDPYTNIRRDQDRYVTISRRDKRFRE